MPSILPLCEELPVRSFAPGAVLLPEGQRTGLIYILIEGTVKVEKASFEINTVSDPGAIFGEISTLLNNPHMATVRAVTACRAHVVTDSPAFLKSRPAMAYELARLLAQRLDGVTAYLVDLKRQYEDQTNHLNMVDDVLEALVHQQRRSFTPGSDRDSEV